MLTIVAIEVDDPFWVAFGRFTQSNCAAGAGSLLGPQSYLIAACNRATHATELSFQPHNSGAETFASASRGLAGDPMDALGTGPVHAEAA
jgi:hypothetical protein